MIGWWQHRQRQIRDDERQRLLLAPCEVHFLIPIKSRVSLTWIEQDEREHEVDRIVIPAHSEIPIQLAMRPRVSFEETELYVGCEGDDGNRPRITQYFNSFIVRGKHKEDTPETNDNHYVDSDGYYHMRERRTRVKEETYVTGFMLRAYSQGKYEFRVRIGGTERLGTMNLRILVEDHPTTPMVCLLHPECFLNSQGNESAHD